MSTICENPKFTDAPFCSGPSDPSRADLPFGSAIPGCNTHEGTGYIDVALSEGHHVVEINGEVVDEITLEREDVSEQFGLDASNYGDQPEGPGEVTITSTFDGQTKVSGGTYEIECATEVQSQGDTPAPTETLPNTGPESLALALTAILAVGSIAIGNALRKVR